MVCRSYLFMAVGMGAGLYLIRLPRWSLSLVSIDPGWQTTGNMIDRSPWATLDARPRDSHTEEIAIEF